MSLVATSFIATSALIHQLKRSVVYLKENEIVLTNDVWRVAIDFSTGTYEVISAIRKDLLLMKRQRKEFTSFSELRQIESY